MLRLSLDEEGSEELIYTPDNDQILEKVGNSLTVIVEHYLFNSRSLSFTKLPSERKRMIIQELVFKDFHQNGILNFREQELNKVISMFSTYKNKIKERLSIDLKTLIELCEFSETDYVQKSIKAKSFILNSDFLNYKRRVSKLLGNSDALLYEFEKLPDEIVKNVTDFYAAPHKCLLFSKEDYYRHFSKIDVDIFCELFTIDIENEYDTFYYSQPNPLEKKPIIKLQNGTFLNVYQKQLPAALYQLLYKTLTDTKKEKEQINHRRGKVVFETQVKDIFENFFKKAKWYACFTNYTVNNFIEEKDLLFIVNRSAYIVECKASRKSEPRRDLNQAIQRIEAEFKESIQKGYDQCVQVENLLESSDNVVINTKTGAERIDMSKIDNIFSIIITAERFGSIQTDLGFLLERESEGKFYPWSAGVDDLETFLKTLALTFNNPIRKFSDFLLYRESLHGRLFARDELDVCAIFVKNPTQFKRLSNSKNLIMPDTSLQEFFDKLYFSKKLNFKIKEID